MRRLLAAAALVILVGLLAACADETATGPTAADYSAERERLRAQMAKNRAREAQAPKAPAAQPAEPKEASESGFGSVASTYTYDPRGKRDPFRSFRHENGPMVPTVTTPLMNYELGQLSVVAIVWDSEKPRALIQDPRGENYVVKEGSPIGKNDGLVIHIGDNLVLVKETYVDFAGETTTKDVELQMRGTQGG